MALHTDTQTSNPSSAAPSPTDQGGHPQQRQAYSFFGAGRTVMPVTRQTGSEVLGLAYEKLRKIYEAPSSTRDQFKLQVHLLDATKETAVAQLAYSAVIVAAGNKAESSFVSYHLVILEASGKPLENITSSNTNGVNITIERPATAAYNATYLKAAEEVMKRLYPGRRLNSVSAEMVPKGFNWEDTEAVKNLATNAEMPVLNSTRMQEPDFVEINFRKDTLDANFKAEISLNQPTHSDYLGLPVHSPVVIRLSAQAGKGENNNKNNNLDANSQSASRPISTIGGFMDVQWAGMQAGGGVAFGRDNFATASTSRVFGARFVITAMENEEQTNTAGQVLSMCTAQAFLEAFTWLNYFRNRNLPKDKKDYREIGALNIEANVAGDAGGVGNIIDTSSANFNDAKLFELASKVFHPNTSLAVDVSDCGADTWMNEIFAAAANKNADAQLGILKATSRLTNGALQKFYTDTSSPVILQNERVLMGHFRNDDGTRSDLREIDYLWVANRMGKAGVKELQAWSQTYNPNWDAARSLAMRREMIRNLVSDVVFTGEAQRVTIKAKFLQAAIAALGEQGFTARPSLPGGIDVTNNRESNISQDALLSEQSSGLFTRSFDDRGGAYGGRQYGNRNW